MAMPLLVILHYANVRLIVPKNLYVHAPCDCSIIPRLLTRCQKTGLPEYILPDPKYHSRQVRYVCSSKLFSTVL